jgi:hypothetical protein
MATGIPVETANFAFSNSIIFLTGSEELSAAITILLLKTNSPDFLVSVTGSGMISVFCAKQVVEIIKE